MIRMTGYDAEPEAMLIAEAVCVICDRLCGMGDIAVQADWYREFESWDGRPGSPIMPVHKGLCDKALSTAIDNSDGMSLWWRLEHIPHWLSHNLADLPAPGDEIGDTILRSRHPFSVDLRKTADLLDLARSIWRMG